VQRPEPTLDGDAARGKTFFTPCIACHGPDGGGNQALFGPPIRQLNDWYVVQQLENFKAGIRGTNPKDTYGALMAPMAATLPDEQAMRDVAAYLATLGR